MKWMLGFIGVGVGLAYLLSGVIVSRYGPRGMEYSYAEVAGIALVVTVFAVIAGIVGFGVGSVVDRLIGKLAKTREGVSRAGMTRMASTILSVVLAVVIMVGLFSYLICFGWESSRRTDCLNFIRQIELGLIQYAGEYNDNYPTALVDDNEPAQRRFARLLKLNYLNAPQVFKCPSTGIWYRPEVGKLNGATLEQASVATIADVFLDERWCSYGIDPRVQHTMGASRAVIADRPDHRFWGTGVSSPPAGQPGSNSENHRGEGQCVGYNDGHVKWSPNCKDDSGIDPSIYADNPEVNKDDDSNVRFGTKQSAK